MRGLLATILFLLLNSCNSKQDSIYPKMGTITTSIYASATVQPDSAYTVYSNVGGILDKVYIKEGDMISINSPLFEVINVTSKSNAQNAALNVTLSKERYTGTSSILESLRENINAAKLVVSNDSINYERQSRLWKKNIGSKAQFESQKLKFQQSKARLSNLKNDYCLKETELRSNMKQAQNNYNSALSQSSDFTIKSKINGSVYDVLINPGEIINPQKGLAYIGSADIFIIEMLIDEVDIIKVLLGQEVLITLEAYPNEVFVARVSKIYPQKDIRNQTFTIEARFVTPPEKLYAGLSGEANIITSIKENVLIIPNAYLIDDNHIRTSSGAVEVTVGLQSIDSVEITSGITTQTELFKPEQ